MSPIAIYYGNIAIYWSAIVICLGVAAGFCLSYGLYTGKGGRGTAMLFILPVALLLSVLFSRLLHWNCHMEQYDGFVQAMTDYSTGGYCLPGAFLGTILAVLLAKRLRLADSAGMMFDAIAPGASLGIAMIRLSALFNSSCRSTIRVTTPMLQQLPVASAVTNSSGTVEYRFATFFVQFLLMLALTVFLLLFQYKRRKVTMKRGARTGHVALAFLLIYSAMEIVLDSTRYDSSFFRINGFVSMVQIISAFSMVAVLVYDTVLSVKANGRRLYQLLVWLGFLACFGVAGYFEYLVQRHGDWYLLCYGVMSLGCILMALLVYAMYRTVLEKPGSNPPAKTVEPETAS